jgi:hypothetical protein
MFITGIWALLIVVSPQAQQVRQTCDVSHTVRSNALEQRCGKLQDTYKLEYVCASIKPNALCWMESK